LASPAQPGPGLGHHLSGAAQDDLQLADRRDQPPGWLVAVARDPASGVDQHPARLTRGGLDEIGQLPGDCQLPGLGFVVAQLQVRRDRPGPPARRRSRTVVRVAPPAVWINATSRVSSVIARTSSPESVG
jgi:hypothetical protein